MIPEETKTNDLDGKKEACKTYVEQTKLLVALSSAFLVAPPVVLVRTSNQAVLSGQSFWWFVATEFCFVISVLLGYAVLASIAGSQDEGTYDVYRLATRTLSLLQLFSYLSRLVLFVVLIVKNIQPR
jgi:hypothetical protein